MKRYLIIFSIIFTTALQAQKLKDITWVLIKIEDVKEKTNINLHHSHSILRFEDSTYTGYGCNGFSGKYKIIGNTINFLGGMQVTDNGCGNPDDYKAQNYILDNLIQLQYKLVGETLTLSKTGEVIFIYKKKLAE